jgi:transcriptional regulator with XRE-family HTH domain
MKKTLGQVLKERRALLQLTQRELALKLGVKPSHVAYLETNSRRPSLGLLSRIADVLGLPKESLFALAHPEARSFLGTPRDAAPPQEPVKHGMSLPVTMRYWPGIKSSRVNLRFCLR